MDKYTPHAQKFWGGTVKSISWIWDNPAVVWPFLFAVNIYAMWSAKVEDITKYSFIGIAAVVFVRFVILWNKNDNDIVENKKLTGRRVHALLSGLNVDVSGTSKIRVTANGSTQEYIWPDGVKIIKDLCPDFVTETQKPGGPSVGDDENDKTPVP